MGSNASLPRVKGIEGISEHALSMRQVWLGIGDSGGDAGGFIEEKETVIARPDESALGTRHDGADTLADVPDLLLTGGGREGEDFVRFDVDVEEAVAMPDGAFAPDGDVVGNGFRSQSGGRWRFAASFLAWPHCL